MDLQKRFTDTVLPKLQKELQVKNVMAIPRLEKVVVNMGVGSAIADKKNIERAAKALEMITGQKPKIIRARKSIATFKLRQGDQIGVAVTLRGKRMYLFLEKLIDIVLPRIRDFRGVKTTSFDGNGNYSLGFSEYSVFPEIDPASVERIQGMEIIMVTSAQTNDAGIALLRELGMPFVKEGDIGGK